MRAEIHTRYGPPDVSSIQEVPRPVPKANEILIKVHASTVNRTDAGLRSAAYFISRFFTGLFRPKAQTLGCEFAGVIEELGNAVTTFTIGDKVFGFNDKTFGGHGEYMTISENAAVTTIPHAFSFENAAPITEGAHYALNTIRAAKIGKDHQVMVYGSTGAIGSAAVQLMKYFGANVTAVCNTKNVALLTSMGADTVIDYQTQDFTGTDKKFDFILDAVGKSSFAQCKPMLSSKGIYISTELGKNGENIYLALVTPLFGGKRVLFPIPAIKKEDVIFLKQLVEAGQFKPVIDRIYPLDQLVEAYTYVESGQKTGNVVLKIST